MLALRNNKEAIRPPCKEGSGRLSTGTVKSSKWRKLRVAKVARVRDARPVKIVQPPAPKQLPVSYIRADPPAPVAPVQLPEPINGKVYAGFAVIRAWGEARGMNYDGTNIAELNRRRVAMNAPPLVQDDGART